MQSTYKHTVIIPVYNRYEGLKRALQSIRSKDYKVQVIVVDDGSTMNYDKILNQNYHNLDINYIKIENSGGPALPRNIGISHAKGEWISFLDSDDYFHKNKFNFLDKLDKTHINFIHHKAKTFGLSEKKLGSRPFFNLNFHLWKLSNPVVLSSVSIKKDFLIKNKMYFDVSLNSIEDYDLWLRLSLIKSFKSFYINSELCFYQIGNNSISQVHVKHLLKYFRLLKKYKNTKEYYSINVNIKLIIASILIKLKKRIFAREIIFGSNYFSNMYLIPKAIYLYMKL
jgi:glycosyltransferase involved in cell wall biosynthesis